MAMCDPTVPDLQRLPTNSHDVALLSFGLSKPMYAGGGGLALTRCSDMAARLRQQRDQDLQQAASRTNLKMLARTVAHDEWLYGIARRTRTTGSQQFSTSTTEWHSAPTRWQLQRSLDNLRRGAESRLQRARLVQQWRNRLAHVGVIVPDQFHDSHLSVRIPANERDRFVQSLKQQGIDAGTLFPLHKSIDAAAYSNADSASQEVINLPLHRRTKVPARLPVRAEAEKTGEPSLERAAA